MFNMLLNLDDFIIYFITLFQISLIKSTYETFFDGYAQSSIVLSTSEVNKLIDVSIFYYGQI